MLQQNIIIKLNMDVSMVVLDYKNYLNKMITILGDASKFIHLEPDVTHDKTKDIELKFRKCLLKLVKDYVLSVAIYEAVRFDCGWSQLYGLPKAHKEIVPLRLIQFSQLSFL